MQIKEEILNINQILRNQLEEGFDLSDDTIVELTDLLTDEVIEGFPNTTNNAEIREDIEELLRQYEEGMEGIREIESLVENVFKAYNEDSEYTGDAF
jgi:hypothetical protein